MAILSKDEYFNRLNDYVGSDSRDETISFVEDMTDTYNDMERKRDGENWEQKYHDLDNAWRERYKKRFFSGESNIIPSDDPDEIDDTAELTIDALFKED